jgi:hypothetical protein
MPTTDGWIETGEQGRDIFLFDPFFFTFRRYCTRLYRFWSSGGMANFANFGVVPILHSVRSTLHVHTQTPASPRGTFYVVVFSSCTGFCLLKNPGTVQAANTSSRRVLRTGTRCILGRTAQSQAPLRVDRALSRLVGSARYRATPPYIIRKGQSSFSDLESQNRLPDPSFV